MHVRVVRVQYKPGLLNDFLSVYRQAAMPALIQEQGFSGILVLSNAQTNAGLILTLWNSEAALERSELSSRKAVASMLLPFLTHNPQLGHYEVLVRAGQYVGGLAARVITLPVPREHVDPALAIYEEEYLPLLKQQPGFQGVIWLADQSQGTGLGVSLWTSLEQMQAADQVGGFFPDVLSRLAAYFAAPAVMGYYDINVQA